MDAQGYHQQYAEPQVAFVVVYRGGGARGANEGNVFPDQVEQPDADYGGNGGHARSGKLRRLGRDVHDRHREESPGGEAHERAQSAVAHFLSAQAEKAAERGSQNGYSGA